MNFFLFLIVLCLPISAHASPITFGFTGVANLGSFSGSYTFDSDAGPVDGHYDFDGPFIINFAATTLQWSHFQINVFNDVPSAVPTFRTDNYTVLAFTGVNPTVFNLKDCDGNTFGDNSLPLTLDLNSFRPNCSLGDEVVIQGSPGGHLTSLFAVAAPVPEPSAWWLMLLGVVAVIYVNMGRLIQDPKTARLQEGNHGILEIRIVEHNIGGLKAQMLAVARAAHCRVVFLSTVHG
jgi:hypothetical protein